MEDEIAKRLGKVLSSIRGARHLSQRVFAKIICVSDETYAKYEQGKRKPAKLPVWIESTIRLINENANSMYYDTLTYQEMSTLRSVGRENFEDRQLVVVRETNVDLTAIQYDALQDILAMLSTDEIEMVKSLWASTGEDVIFKKIANLTGTPYEVVKQEMQYLLSVAKKVGQPRRGRKLLWLMLQAASLPEYFSLWISPHSEKMPFINGNSFIIEVKDTFQRDFPQEYEQIQRLLSVDEELPPL